MTALGEQHKAHLERRARLLRGPVQRPAQRAPEEVPASPVAAPTVVVRVFIPIFVPIFIPLPTPTYEETSVGEISIKQVLDTVAKFYSFPVLEILSGRRHKYTVLIRHVVMYLAHLRTRRSYPQIGHHLGGRDHTTVIYGATRIARRLKGDPELRREIDGINRQLDRLLAGEVA